MKTILVLTSGGDCPGLNTVIRALVRAAYFDDQDWRLVGSRRSFMGVLDEPQDLMELTIQSTSGIHVKGGTILETVNKGDPFFYPIQQADGTWSLVDRSDELAEKLDQLKVDVVINIGGDGSQKISLKLAKKGVAVIGIPKTIDNDLFGTDITFGFQTAAQIATEAVDKLVTTAQSHNRIMISEVMGRDAGWICLHAAVAACAEVALIPEIPYDFEKVLARVSRRIQHGRGLANIVVAEGARPIGGEVVSEMSHEVGYQNRIYGGISYHLMEALRKHEGYDCRVTVLGHVQRGGTPIASDRILATQFACKAFELVKNEAYGQMVSYTKGQFIGIPLEIAISQYKSISDTDYLLQAARKIGICLGD